MHHASTAIPPEVVAAITAALSAVLDQPGQFEITSIQPEGSAYAAAPPTPASGWARAGVLESHLARRQFGFRSR